MPLAALEVLGSRGAVLEGQRDCTLRGERSTVGEQSLEFVRGEFLAEYTHETIVGGRLGEFALEAASLQRSVREALEPRRSREVSAKRGHESEMLDRDTDLDVVRVERRENADRFTCRGNGAGKIICSNEITGEILQRGAELPFVFAETQLGKNLLDELDRAARVPKSVFDLSEVRSGM